MTDCVFVAVLGANPAALAQALWALPRHHDSRVREVFVLSSPRGRAVGGGEVGSWRLPLAPDDITVA